MRRRLLPAADLVAAVPQRTDVAEVTAVLFRQVASPDLDLNDMIALVREIEQAVANGAGGAVVTQGHRYAGGNRLRPRLAVAWRGR
jgi:L-asparaginase